MKKLQYKLVFNILLTSTLPLIVLAIITIIFLHRIAVNEAQERIKNKLNTAKAIYQGLSDNLRHIVGEQNQRVCSLIETNRVYLLRKELTTLSVNNRLDFFLLTDSLGKVISSVSNPSLAGADFSKEFSIQKALGQKRTFVSTEVVPEEELRRLGLANKAKIRGLKEAVISGLVIKAVAPITNRDETVIGTMTAGYLLNNNSFIVDKITESTKFPTSIFLRGMRISTNLPYSIGKFALGSGINGEAAQNLLKRGKDYIGRMWIVNRWYLAGYSTLYDYDRESVGILGIAIPEYTIFVLRDNLVLFFGFFVFLSIILAFMTGILRGNRIVSQIEELHNGIEAFGEGNYDYRVRIKSGDEIEALGDFFNRTMSQLREARQHVLDLRREVRKSSEQLQLTQKQLLDSEKMAAMGKMATAINHELKNAFAQIESTVSYLRSKEIKDPSRISAYLKEIENGVNYADGILANLLRLSHPKRIILSDVDLNFLIADLLASDGLRETIKKYRVEVKKDFDPAIPKIKADGLQMRELFKNLITNSLQAMQDGGKLSISSKIEQDSLKVEVSDTGGGIPQELVESVFTPFFTTKSKGMGLGLCIAKDIVEAHKGSIEFKTDSATYTTFIVRIPATNGA